MKYFKNYKPYTRWWWFSNKIEKRDICYQLNWLKKNYFGGVEIAFVYPLENEPPGVKFLSQEWIELVQFTKFYAKKIGLGCDITFGSLWPFGGSFVSKKDSSRVYNGFSRQRIFYTWEHREHSNGVRVLDHLSKNALKNYSKIIGEALKTAIKIDKTFLFCDSWEVETEGLWTKNFRKTFKKLFGYDILSYMAVLNKYPSVRYDYRKLISEYTLDFYKNFTSVCHNLKANSRVQCHGAPTDLISAYSEVDIPESEAILFDPSFSAIASSAATLSDKKTVSCESFTCLYGWKPRPGPAPFIKREIISDLKILVDSLFANGINQIIWHGMPFNPKGKANEFYASVFVSEKGELSKHFKYFNKYIEKVSSFMQKGNTYSDIAVYLPYEDLLMKNKLPKEKRKPSAKYYWEMHDVKFPEELRGFHPIWINKNFINKSRIVGDKFKVGNAYFSMLYVFSKWLDYESLKSIYKLAKAGIKICFKNNFYQTGKVKNNEYNYIKRKLFKLKNICQNLSNLKPLIKGIDLPEFWCKKDREEYFIFFANPFSKKLTYPLKYGYSLKNKRISRKIIFNIKDIEISYTLKFDKNQSILIKINKNRKISQINLGQWKSR